MDEFDKLKVDKVLGYLSDLKSKEIFNAIIKKRENGIMDYSDLMSEGEYFNSEFFFPCKNAIYVDAGSYDGDSILGFIKFNQNFKKIFAFEPDEYNYNILKKSFVYNVYREKITLFDFALSDKKETTDFDSGKGVSSHLIDEQPSLINNKIKVSCQSLDNLIDEKVSFIKMDIEGAEIRALNGAKRLITTYKPDLAICIYHKEMDIFEIPELIHRMVPEYKIYIRHHGPEYTDTVLYATVKK